MINESAKMRVINIARRIVADEWGTGFSGFGVVYTFSPIFNRIPNRRRAAQRIEGGRLLGVVAHVVQRLQEGHDTSDAVALATSEGFGDCIRATSSNEELVIAVADRFRAGDSVCDPYPADGGVVRIGFYHDRTHRRLQ